MSDLEKGKEIFTTKLNEEQQEVNTETNRFFQEMLSDKEKLLENLQRYLPMETPEAHKIILDFLLEIAPKVRIEALSSEETLAFFEKYNDTYLDQVDKLYSQDNIVSIPAVFAFSKNVWGTGQGFAHDKPSESTDNDFVSETYEPTRQQYFCTPKVPLFMSKVGLSRAISIFIEMHLAYSINSATRKLSNNSQRPLNYIAVEYPLRNTSKENMQSVQSLLGLAQKTREIDALYEEEHGKLFKGEAFILEVGEINPVLKFLSERVFRGIDRLNFHLITAKDFPKALQQSLQRLSTES